MALLDFLVDAKFRSEKGGPAVVFPGDRHNRGYLAKSQAEELRSRSFLKMFFCAHISILLLGCLLAAGWSADLSYVMDRQAADVLRVGAVFLGIYLLVVGLPYWLFWRAYKKAFPAFVSAQDEIVVSAKPARRQLTAIRVGLIAFATLLLAGLYFLVRAK